MGDELSCHRVSLSFTHTSWEFVLRGTRSLAAGFPCHLLTLVGGSVLRVTSSLATGPLVVYLH